MGIREDSSQGRGKFQGPNTVTQTSYCLHNKLEPWAHLKTSSAFPSERQKAFVCACVCAESLSHVQLFLTPWTVAHQAPLSMGFSRQEYWSGLSFPSPGDLLDPGIKPTSLLFPKLAGQFFTTSTTKYLIACNCSRFSSVLPCFF